MKRRETEKLVSVVALAFNLLKNKTVSQNNIPSVVYFQHLLTTRKVKGKTMEWISIDERLPASGERVLLYTPYRFFGNDNACIGDADSINLCTTVVSGKTVSVFTHWLPLPQLPSGGPSDTRRP